MPMSDDEYSSYEEQSQDKLDMFLTKHLDTTLDLFYDLQDRFPYVFGTLKSTDLTDLILVCCDIISSSDSTLNCKLFSNDGLRNDIRFSKFLKEYENEIRVSHWVVERFLSTTFKRSIQSDMWCVFCYLHCM
jgi:hypothetical protein